MVGENPKARILAVDDNEDSLYALEKMLSHNGFVVETAASGADAIEKAKSQVPELILLDVMMPEIDGLEVTRRLKADAELKFVPIILLTAKDSLQDVVRGLDNGADGYITKPFKPEELIARTRAALRLKGVYQELQSTQASNTRLKKQLSERYDLRTIIGESQSMKNVFSLVEKVARSDSPVLIEGASGTGKELVARAIHFNSPRKNEAFIAKNCAAFSEHLLESQLFGHKKGAFTGAVKDQEGLFEAADGGTLFLDEIGEMDLSLQAKLLRVLQEGTFMPVGSMEEKGADVRIIAASNRDLRAMSEEGSFREDLYYRLNVVGVTLPKLEERREDIPLLIAHFLEQHAEKRGGVKREISAQAMQILQSCSWRGNIRELENEIERMLILGVDDEVLDVNVLSPRLAESASVEIRDDSQETAGELKAAIENLERRMISDALEHTKGNKTTAAKKLGISRSNLITKVKQYGIEE